MTLAWVWRLARLWGQPAPQLPISRGSWSSYPAAGRVSGAGGLLRGRSNRFPAPRASQHDGCGKPFCFGAEQIRRWEGTFSGGISLEQGLRMQL